MKNEKIEQLKETMLNQGYTLIQHNPNFLTYTKDNKFGSLSVDKHGKISLSSSYKPSKKHGTGAGYTEAWKVGYSDIEKAMNFTVRNPDNDVIFYKDIQDYLVGLYAVAEAVVITKEKTVKALELLDGYFVFKSNNHALVVSKNHSHLLNNFYNKRDDEFKVIFEIKNGKVEALNHNINLFDNLGEMKALENKVMGA
jgi:hypothetical protein